MKEGSMEMLSEEESKKEIDSFIDTLFEQYTRGDGIYQANTIERFTPSLQQALRVDGGMQHVCETLCQKLEKSKILLNHEVKRCTKSMATVSLSLKRYMQMV
ncbi:MAG: hypothetical protein U9O64_00610 [Campylobacterota bacterium]|nr:hypothetical protein [Campylobacterota bacterium]